MNLNSRKPILIIMALAIIVGIVVGFIALKQGSPQRPRSSSATPSSRPNQMSTDLLDDASPASNELPPETLNKLDPNHSPDSPLEDIEGVVNSLTPETRQATIEINGQLFTFQLEKEAGFSIQLSADSSSENSQEDPFDLLQPGDRVHLHDFSQASGKLYIGELTLLQ
jgi:hypothetical protein